MTKVGFVRLTVFLTEDEFTLQVFAGTSRGQVDDPKLRMSLVLGKQKDIVREVLLKLEAALKGSQRSIDLETDDLEIKRDTTFPLPSAAAKAASALALAKSTKTKAGAAKSTSSTPSEKPKAKKTAAKAKREDDPKKKAPKSKAEKSPKAKSSGAKPASKPEPKS